MSRRDWLVVGLVVSLGSYGVLAQENRDPDQRDRSDPVRTDKDVLRTGANVDPDTNAPVFRAKTLIGYKVKNRQGEDLGKIEELAIDPETGQIAYAVLSFGGFLGLGDKLFAIPWSALQPRHSDEVFLLDVDKEQLKNAPGFDKDKWPDMADRRWGTGIHGFYGARPYWESSGSQSGFMRDPGLIGKAGETHRLPFKLEKNKSYAFHVMAAGMGERFRAGTGTGRTDETRASTDTSRSGTDTSRTDPARSGTYQGHALAKSHIYRVRVQDTSSSGDSTLLVTVDQGDSVNPTQVDERQDDRSSTEGRSAAGAAGASKNFTVVVDQDGRVKSFRKEGAAAGSTPSTTQPGSTTAGSPHMSEEECSTHLQAVLGSGLHQQPLEVGKFYSASQLFRAGAISGSGTSATPSDSFRSSAGAQSTSEALPNCQLRFDGKTRGAAGDVARFTIFSSDTGLAPAASRSGTSGTTPGTSATEGERRGEQGTTTPRDQDPSRSGTATRALAGGERPIGEIAYRFDDGLLENLQVQKSAAATDTSSPQHVKLSMGLTVRRIEAGSR